jgi:hypothetical protein
MNGYGNVAPAAFRVIVGVLGLKYPATKYPVIPLTRATMIRLTAKIVLLIPAGCVMRLDVLILYCPSRSMESQG